jgi:hypothetical protein
VQACTDVQQDIEFCLASRSKQTSTSKPRFEQKLPKHLKYRSRPRLLISHLGEFVRLSCARVTNLGFGDALPSPSGESYACTPASWRTRIGARAGQCRRLFRCE